MCMIEKEDLSTNQIGHSGEFLAASMLQRIFPAIAFPQTIAHYDILCETKSGDFVKCQVKTTNKIEVNAIEKYKYWRFSTSRRDHGSVVNKYEENDLDFFAFVCLKKNLVVFVNADDVGKKFYRIPVDKMNKRKQDSSLKKIDRDWNN